MVEKESKVIHYDIKCPFQPLIVLGKFYPVKNHAFVECSRSTKNKILGINLTV